MSGEIQKSEREIELERIAQEQHEMIQRLSAQVISYGCPTKYSDDFIPILLQHMGIEGKSYTSLTFKLGINTVTTLYNWEKRYPQWKRAKEMANNGRLGVIEDLLINLGTGKVKGNAAAAIFYAKNAAPDEFKDKREIDVGGSVTYVIDTGIPQRQLPQGEETQEFIDADFTELHSDEEEEEYEDLL
ncbi:MAG: hypothetical protein KAS32_31265 [Candidatus Peribacteraceae bacterium]|nr:hypothetical protein [Candidatus Peribacteraceae bacterium]